MKANFYLTLAILIIGLVSCNNSKSSNQNQVNTNQDTQTGSQTVCDIVERDTIISTPFLKNTTYIYWKNSLNQAPILVDSSYTPPVKYKLKNITVQLKLNQKIAIVTTNQVITHKIKSIEYFNYTKYYKEKNGTITFDDDKYTKKPSKAIIRTNKGEIIIVEPNKNLSSGETEQYRLSIKYGSYVAGDELTLNEY